MQSPLRVSWSKGQPTFGAFSGPADLVSVEKLAGAGYDFIVIDLEHGSATLDSLLPLILAVEVGGSTAVVRVPWNDPATIMRVLDYGAAGVIVPMVSTAVEAAAAANACRYPPRGIRSFGQMRGKTYGGPDGANEEVLCIVMVETVEGLENVSEIAATPGVDAIFVGPVDLSLGLGLPPGTPSSHPTLARSLETILNACLANDCIAGGFIMDGAEVKSAVSDGWKFVAVRGTVPLTSLR